MTDRTIVLTLLPPPLPPLSSGLRPAGLRRLPREPFGVPRGRGEARAPRHARRRGLAPRGLFHKEIASSAGLSPILNADGRNPSVLNGFTGPASVAFVVAAFAGIGMQESVTLKSQYISPQDFNQRPAAFAKKGRRAS